LEGESRKLPDLFLVLATQNPVEFHGVYPLPEAQMDRFLIRMELGYPSAEVEQEMLFAHQRSKPLDLMPVVLDPAQVLAFQAQVREVFVDPTLAAYAIALVQATRTHPDVRLPASPRGSMGLFRLSQAFAWMDNRDHVLPEDMQRSILPVLGHRIFPREGRSWQASARILEDVKRSIPIPR